MSRQDTLDTYPQLGQLFGGYFHQDWAIDRDQWEPAVDEFITESAHSVVMEAADELGTLLAGHPSDEELAAVLEGFGASVEPAAIGMTATAWLESVLQRLRSSR